MGKPRLELHEKLRDFLGTDHVYFQPPESVRLVYPCIVYERSRGLTRFAGDNPYNFDVGYTVTYISLNPDDPKVDELAMAFPKITYDRHFDSDNLNHDVFVLYY